jgi:N-succinyl-L-ornithine transcarbamylase
MKRFISVDDVPDIPALLQSALNLKKDPHGASALGRNKTLAMLFFNPSLRTRLSTEKAALNLGMHVISMNADQGWNLEFEDGAIMNGTSAEHIREAAAVISQYADIIGVRSFPLLKDREKDYADQVINSFCRYASAPVISLESAIRHPLQSLTDLLTIEELKTHPRPKVVLSWAPHPRNLPQAVPNSFVEWMLRADVDLVITHPKGYELSESFTQNAQVEYNQDKAFEGADFIYAKNWSSYNLYGQNLSQDASWRITPDKMAITNNARFMHCLPVRRNVIVDDAVLDGPQSAVIQQAGNRTFAAMAVLKSILENI